VPDLSADRPLLLPDEDLEKLAEAIYEHDVYDVPGGWYKPWSEVDKATYKEYRWRAIGAVGWLAKVGRLLPASAEHRDRDMDVLAMVGRMYLDALDGDPDNEMLTLPEAILVTEVRDAVERRERSWTEVDGSTDD